MLLRHSRRLALVAGFALTAGLVPLLSAAPAAAVSPDVVVNEVYGGGGNTGATVQNDFVELRNLGAVAVDLSTWSVQYASATGTSWAVTSLTGTIPAGGRYLVQEAAGSGAGTALPAPDDTGTIALSGTAGKVALVAGASTCAGADCGRTTPGSAVRDFVGYGSTASAFEGTAPTPAPSNTASVARGSSAPDTDSNAADFTAGAPTPENRSTTAAPTPGSPVPAGLTLISTVQGPGATSPLVGARVMVEAVVTATKTRDDAVVSYFLQEQDADADASAATSEGLSVLCGGQCPPGLAAGDVVQATGVVQEASGLTRLDASSATTGASVRTGGAARPTPAQVRLPAATSTADPTTFETVEGMLTTIPDTLSVTESFNLARFGEVTLAAGRAYQFTHTSAPSTSGNTASLAELAKRRIVLDDASEDQNDAVSGPQSEEPYPFPTGGLSTTNRFRAGDTLTGTTAVMEYGFGGWRLQPALSETYRPVMANPRPTAPDAVAGRLKVASANVLNYFATVDTTASNSTGPCSPSGTLDCRGADSAAELVLQRTKTVAELKALDADVLGLIEVENDSATATAQLVDGLNAATAPGTYDYVRTGTIGTDAIKLAILFRRNVVAPVGAFKTLTSAVDPAFLDTRNRPALIQTFQERKTGNRFTFALNHLKSKGSSCGSGDDATDGSGNCDGTRTAAAGALVRYLATDPTGSGDPDFLIMGDLNSYKRERPITTIEDGGYRDLIERFQGDGAYGYLFDGQLGYLDHALASTALDGQVTGATEWHANADEPALLDYNDGVADPGEAAFERESSALATYAPDAYRSSDHDPVVVGLDLKAPATTTPYEVQVLGINDFHGRLQPPVAGTATTPSRGGAAFLAGAINQFRAEVRSTTLVSAGDNIGATPFASAVQQDKPAIDALNAMALEVTSVGNHEFDRGYADLIGRVARLASFPFLGANVVGETPQLPATHTVTLADGITIATIGVTTEQTGTLVSPDGIRGITFADITATVNTAAAALTDGDPANGEADVVVLLAHEGPGITATTPADCEATRARDDAFGAVVRGVTADVDAIIAGHTHQVVSCQLPQTGGRGAVRPVLEAGEYGQFLDRLRFTWDPTAKRISNIRTEAVPVLGGAFPGAFTPDPAVKKIVDDAVASAAVVGRVPVGRITQDILRGRSATGAVVRNVESLLGNFIADVQLGATARPELGGAQIAFMNPGGLRTDLLFASSPAGEGDGVVTYGEAADVQPFANGLVTVTLTGAQVKSALEQQYRLSGTVTDFLALGVSKGFRYEFLDSAAAGDRIRNITLDGAPLDPARDYRVSINSFLAAGGDAFSVLAQGRNRQDNGFNDLDVLVERLRPSLTGTPVTPDKDDRAVPFVVTPSPAPTPPAPTSPAPTPPAPTSPAPTPPAPTPTAPTPTAPPAGTPLACAVPATVVLGRTTIVATGSAPLTIRAAPGSTVEVLAYTRPASTYRVVRTGVVGSAGSLVLTPLRPPANTRLFARVRGCGADPRTRSVVLDVRTALTLAATRTGRRTYVFSGGSLPARPGGLLVSLYRVEANGRQVLTAQVRASASTGRWRVTRAFAGAGRFGFVVRTGRDLRNAPGASNVRPTLVF